MEADGGSNRLMDLLQLEAHSVRPPGTVACLQSRRLWRPAAGRGAFGGQIAAHALLAAAHTVDVSVFVPHSLHCTFVAPVHVSEDGTHEPVRYLVHRIRDGRSFVLRRVVAVQTRRRKHGTTAASAAADDEEVLHAVASFHSLTEPSPWDHAYRIPQGLPPPAALPDTTARLLAILRDPRLPDVFRPRLESQLNDASAVDVRYCRLHDPLSLTPTPPHHVFWLRTQPVPPPHDAPPGWGRILQAAAATYASDLSLLGTAVLPFGSPNPFVAMMASLDHTVWFHADLQADQWLCFECESPRLVSGRGLAIGRLFTQTGALVASVAQEGLVRLHAGIPPSAPVWTDRGELFSGRGASHVWRLADSAGETAGAAETEGRGGAGGRAALAPTSESLLAAGLGDTGGGDAAPPAAIHARL